MIDTDRYYTHPQFRGVVLYVAGEETEDVWFCPGHIFDPDDEWVTEDMCEVEDDGTLVYRCDGCTLDEDVRQPTGRVFVVMVGDDMRHVVDPDELVPYDHPVCSCGQVGCGWHGQEE